MTTMILDFLITFGSNVMIEHSSCYAIVNTSADIYDEFQSIDPTLVYITLTHQYPNIKHRLNANLSHPIMLSILYNICHS